jgi:hypothetical protein
MKSIQRARELCKNQTDAEICYRDTFEVASDMVTVTGL